MYSKRWADIGTEGGTRLASRFTKLVQLRAGTSHQATQDVSVPLGPAQFGTVYETFVERIYAFIFSHVGNREDAEDITSQVFIKAYRNLASFEGRGSFESWLFHIARMAVADFWRARYRLPAIPLADGWDVPSPEGVPDLDQSVREDRVKQLLARLPDNYRDVLVQRFLLRASIAETARALGITEANTRVLQFRALRRAAEVAREGGW